MAYSYSRSITLDHTKCGSADSANFPVLFAGTYSWLATVANGGHVQSSSGYDIVFSSDAAGTSLLSFERVLYSSTTGVVEFWVKVPTVSHTADTVVYVLYGDVSITTDQQSASSVWDTNFSGVWHFGDGSTLGLADSTSNANNGSSFGATAVTGKIGGGAGFTPANIQVGNGASLQMSNTSNWTMEAWVYATTLPSLADIIRYDDSAGTSPLYMVRANGGHVEFTFGSRTATLGSLTTSASLSTSTWTHIVAVRDTSGPTLKIYINGTQSASGSDASTGTWTCNNFNLRFGQYVAGPSESWAGNLDEIRVSHSVRPANWIATEYNNQNSPSTFYALGTEGGSTVVVQPCFFILM